ncbi:MAG: hypothetical protein ACXVIH_05935, partial [Ilumatobacteraceae bacterium]
MEAATELTRTGLHLRGDPRHSLVDEVLRGLAERSGAWNGEQDPVAHWLVSFRQAPLTALR